MSQPGDDAQRDGGTTGLRNVRGLPTGSRTTTASKAETIRIAVVRHRGGRPPRLAFMGAKPAPTGTIVLRL